MVVVGDSSRVGSGFTRRDQSLVPSTGAFDNEGFPVNCTRMNDVDRESLPLPFQPMFFRVSFPFPNINSCYILR